MKVLPMIALSLLVGCSSDPMQTRGLDQAFKVSYGSSATIRGEHLTLAFTAVNEDSRCPTGSMCMVAGQATITLMVARAGLPEESQQLTVPSPDTVTYAGYSITLVQLAPYPSVDHTPRLEEYVATLIVEKT